MPNSAEVLRVSVSSEQVKPVHWGWTDGVGLTACGSRPQLAALAPWVRIPCLPFCYSPYYALNCCSSSAWLLCLMESPRVLSGCWLLLTAPICAPAGRGQDIRTRSPLNPVLAIFAESCFFAKLRLLRTKGGGWEGRAMCSPL